jgi:hypothetical protein
MAVSKEKIFLKNIACGAEECCCKCKYQQIVYGHPSVNGQSVTTPAFFVCVGIEGLILNSTHGLCEVFEHRK